MEAKRFTCDDHQWLWGRRGAGGVIVIHSEFVLTDSPNRDSTRTCSDQLSEYPQRWRDSDNAHRDRWWKLDVLQIGTDRLQKPV